MTSIGITTGMAIATAAVAAYTDLRTGTIPNSLTFGSLAAAPIVTFVVACSANGMSAGAMAALGSVAGALLAGIGPTILFAKNGLGGGDVKLFAALGAWLGLHLGLELQALAFFVAMLWVPGRLAWEGRLFAVAVGWTRSLFNRKVAPPPELARSLRFGPAILAGTVLTILYRSLVA